MPQPHSAFFHRLYVACPPSIHVRCFSNRLDLLVSRANTSNILLQYRFFSSISISPSVGFTILSNNLSSSFTFLKNRFLRRGLPLWELLFWTICTSRGTLQMLKNDENGTFCSNRWPLKTFYHILPSPILGFAPPIFFISLRQWLTT